MAESRPVVRVRGVNHTFGAGDNRKQVLFDNSIDLMPGEVVIMTGPSGSGKTTLLTLIGALRSLQTGSIELHGRELRELGPLALVQARRDVGFIFQAHNLFESLTAFENVSLALELRSPDDDEQRRLVTGMLERLGLGARINHKPQALSGGQRQRVAIARALVREPPLILADEPTAALDKETGRDVIQALKELAARKGTAVLIVTHDSRVLRSADRIVSMIDGAIVSNVAVQETIEVCAFLMKCHLFAGYPAAVLNEFAQQMKLETFEPGEVLIRQGDAGDRFFIVRDGSCDVYITESDGSQVRGDEKQRGDFFGETALITGDPRSATVIARGPVEVLTLDKENFQRALSGSKSFEDQIRAALYHRG